MKKTLLFEGKTTMGGMDVDIKIHKVQDWSVRMGGMRR